MAAKHLSKKDFIEKIFDYEKNGQNWRYEGDQPVLIDFFATWCGPCKSLSPVIDELADEYEGKAHVYKIDVDEENELAGLFGVRSIPTLLFIPRDGQPRLATGVLPKNVLKGEIDKML